MKFIRRLWDAVIESDRKRPHEGYWPPTMMERPPPPPRPPVVHNSKECDEHRGLK